MNRIFCFDLDKTLIENYRDFAPEKFLRIVEKLLEDKNNHIIINSGRNSFNTKFPFIELPKEILNKMCFISSNGSCVEHLQEKEILGLLNNELIKNLNYLVKSRSLLDKCYSDTINSTHYGKIPNNCISIYILDQEHQKEIKDMCNAHDETICYTYDDGACDINNSKFSKGTGILYHIENNLKLKREDCEIIVTGDNNNDIPMTEIADTVFFRKGEILKHRNLNAIEFNNSEHLIDLFNQKFNII